MSIPVHNKPFIDTSKKCFFYVILVMFVLLVFVPVKAEIYRYQDANGKWHFTDEKEDLKKLAKDENKIEKIQLESNANTSEPIGNRKALAVFVPNGLCPTDNARFSSPKGGHWGKRGSFSLKSKRNQNDVVSIYVSNDYFAPVTLKFWFMQSMNVQSSKQLPLTTEVQAQKSYKLLEIKPKHRDRAWNYRYDYQYALGELNPSHSRNCYYLPPVPSGKPYKITQAFNGQFSHTGPYSRYAVDIAMPIGTDIVAARGGVIIERKSDFVLNGIEEKYKRRANVIRILHSDGSIATYAHLEFRTMKFKEGERVEAGQVIGRSGNTGYSTGPHLHFVVHANMDMRLKSVPFQFLNDGQHITPEKGMKLVNKPSLDNEKSY